MTAPLSQPEPPPPQPPLDLWTSLALLALGALIFAIVVGTLLYEARDESEARDDSERKDDSASRDESKENDDSTSDVTPEPFDGPRAETNSAEPSTELPDEDVVQSRWDGSR